MRAILDGGQPAQTAPMPEFVGGDADGTTYLATVDGQGNMVSATPSSCPW
jgi:gamma-glutamyltranspeptidase